MDRSALKQRILDYPRWYHSFQLDSETKITGWAESTSSYPPTGFADGAFAYYHLPPRLDGKTVLDIGGWDGAVALEMERRGASRVVLVNPRRLEDIDLPMSGEGSLADLQEKFRKNNYPLDFIHSGGAALLVEWFNSRVELAHGSIYDVPQMFDQPFDIVSCLGLLYHLRDPVRGLLAASELTQNMLVLETMCFPVDDPRLTSDESLCKFLGGTEGQNWWIFNFRAIEHILQSCGFERFERKEIWQNRTVYHAYKS